MESTKRESTATSLRRLTASIKAPTMVLRPEEGGGEVVNDCGCLLGVCWVFVECLWSVCGVFVECL